ncbi:hypothetical protein ACVW1C_005780 [Bradyrhizobium sp. USDA 4011]
MRCRGARYRPPVPAEARELITIRYQRDAVNCIAQCRASTFSSSPSEIPWRTVRLHAALALSGLAATSASRPLFAKNSSGHADPHCGSSSHMPRPHSGQSSRSNESSRLSEIAGRWPGAAGVVTALTTVIGLRGVHRAPLFDQGHVAPFLRTLPSRPSLLDPEARTAHLRPLTGQSISAGHARHPN